MAGVPVAMAERPIGLLGWARSMIRHIDAEQRKGKVTYVEGRGWVDDRTVEAVARGLDWGFDRLAGVYGSGNAFDLAGWLARNEADWAQKEEWTSWHSWLHSVALDRTEIPLPGSSGAAAKAIIDAGLGRDSQTQYARCEQQAMAVPLSPLEQGLLTFDVAADEEPSSHDVIISMGVSRGRELARAIVMMLRMTLTQEEWESVAAAARPSNGGIIH